MKREREGGSDPDRGPGGERSGPRRRTAQPSSKPSSKPNAKPTAKSTAKPARGGARQALLLGVGLDGSDGHRRITRGRDTLLVGGSQDTHAQMQEKAVKLNEELDRRGIRLGDVRCADELREIADRAGL